MICVGCEGGRCDIADVKSSHASLFHLTGLAKLGGSMDCTWICNLKVIGVRSIIQQYDAAHRSDG
jgi:hypothetical protein